MAREVSRLCVTPVKGMRLLHPLEARLDNTGIAENRRFHLIDAEGGLFSGDDLGTLVAVVPHWETDTERLTFTFPGGLTVEGDAAAVGEPVTTRFAYGRMVDGHLLDGPWSEALSDYAGQPLRLVRDDVAGDGPDVFPLSLVSNESVQDLAARGGRDDDIDSRRFRINIELTGCEPYEEDTWDGTKVRFGDTTLSVLGQIPRCVFTTKNPLTGDKDFDTLKVIASYRPFIQKERGLPFGVYARVETPGVVRVGDTVEPLG
jgi:uncharacterized protein